MIDKITTSPATTAVKTVRPESARPSKPSKENGSDNVEISAGATTPPAIENLAELRFLQLRALVSNIFRDQGISVYGPGLTAAAKDQDLQIETGEGQSIKLSEMTQADAQALVADDGYWGVTKTSERIVALATGVAGNDPTKAGKIREGILRGFDQAKQAFGGTLPEISQKTLEAALSKLDEWANKPAQ